MSYIQNGTIEYGDVNKFATGSTTGTTPNPALENINSLWGTGYGSLGYGQITPVLNTVSQNDVVSASNWTSLVDILNKANRHQSFNTPPVDLALPAKNDIITYQQQYLARLQTLNSRRLNSIGTGSSFRSGNTLSSGWTSEILHNFAITFPTADNARYFFNCGGKIKINFSQSNFSTSSAQAVSTNTLCTQTGNLYISSDFNQSGDSPGVFYGFTQYTYGSIATRTTYDTTGGYYGLTTSSRLLYKMTAADNTGTYLSLSAKTNGAQGVNGDKGNVITVYAKWAVSPIGWSPSPITGAFSTLITILYPETTNLGNSWGTPTVTAV